MFLLVGCAKSDFLNKNPNSKTIIPQSVKNYQAILDEYTIMNTASPSLLELSTDDYYFLSGFLNSVDDSYRNVYLWNDDIWGLAISPNWNNPYSIIFNANIVIEGLNEIVPLDIKAYNNVYGSALFYKAFYYYQLAQVFSKYYIKGRSVSDWGLPLRKGTDINEKVERATLETTYQIIVDNLMKAQFLLPNKPAAVTRPSIHSCYALLARIYNQMKSYDSAYKYSNLSISIKDSLMDFNLDPINQFNKEVIWHASANSSSLPVFDYSFTSVDSNLLNLYSANDLRLGKYFSVNQNGGFYFVGNYDFSGNIFVGLATDEMFLIRAESAVRIGRIEQAKNDMNVLLENRYSNDGSWVPITTNNKDELLKLIFDERRKELCFRGVRRGDLMKLNSEGVDVIIRRRDDDGNEISASPGELIYTFLLPPEVISFNPEMPQNER